MRVRHRLSGSLAGAWSARRDGLGPGPTKHMAWLRAAPVRLSLLQATFLDHLITL